MRWPGICWPRFPSAAAPAPHPRCCTGTPFHTRVVLQSAVMRHALVKPRGYAGDMDLMLMLCDGVPRGNSPFARAVNDVFVRVPAAQAVRDRVDMLGRLLDQLPEGARILNLACGPALEVLRLFAARPERHLLVD